MSDYYFSFINHCFTLKGYLLVIFFFVFVIRFFYRSLLLWPFRLLEPPPLSQFRRLSEKARRDGNREKGTASWRIQSCHDQLAFIPIKIFSELETSTLFFHEMERN